MKSEPAPNHREPSLHPGRASSEHDHTVNGYRITPRESPLARGGAIEVDGRALRCTRIVVSEDVGERSAPGALIGGQRRLGLLGGPPGGGEPRPRLLTMVEVDRKFDEVPLLRLGASIDELEPLAAP